MKKENNTFPAKWYILTVSPEISEIIQKKLFKLGFSYNRCQTPQYLDSEIIFNYGTYLDSYRKEYYFRDRSDYSEYKEISIPELFAMTPLQKDLVFKHGEFLTSYAVTVTKDKIELSGSGGSFSKEEWLKHKAAIDAMLYA